MGLNLENIIQESKNALLELGIEYFCSLICAVCTFISFFIVTKIKPDGPNWLTGISVSVVLLILSLLFGWLGYKNRRNIKILKSFDDTNLFKLKTLIDKDSNKEKELKTATFFKVHEQYSAQEEQEEQEDSSKIGNNKISYVEFANFCDGLTKKGNLKQYIIKFINNYEDAHSFKQFIDEIKKWEKDSYGKLRYQIKILFNESELKKLLPSSLMLYRPVLFSQGFYSSGSPYYIDIPLSATSEDNDIANRIWEEIWSNPMLKTIYDGIEENTGINYETEKELQDYADNCKRGTFSDLSNLKELCHKLYETNILNDINIESIVLFGSYAHQLNSVPNDIDIAIIINNLSTSVRECFNIHALRKIAEEYKFNFKINGLREFTNGYKSTIDFCIDSTTFIKNQDPISLIDIASQPYYVLFSVSKSDPYESLKNISVSYIKKLDRIISSINYIQDNIDIIKSKNETNIILKQFEYSLYHYINTTEKTLQNAFDSARINHPYLLEFIEKCALAKIFKRAYGINEIYSIFCEFENLITPKVNEKLTKLLQRTAKSRGR